MRTEEGALKDYVKRELKKLNTYRYMPVPSGYGQQTLDFLCCAQGKFLGIETKAAGKKPTPRQELCIREIIAAGGAAFWCDSEQMFDAKMQAFGFI